MGAWVKPAIREGLIPEIIAEESALGEILRSSLTTGKGKSPGIVR